MRRGGGHAKGAQWEREVAVILSNWLSSNEKSDIFWRSSMSGGRSTVAFKKGGRKLANQVGDLTCIDPLGTFFINAFAIEIKFYANLDWQGLLTGKGKLLTFWAEINEQARRYGKHPLMIVRQNRMQSHVCFDKEGHRKLGLLTRKMLLISPPSNIYIMTLEGFVRECQPYLA